MTGDAAQAKKSGAGRVALVGAGPGDPDLLTLRAAKLIAEAEIVFTDRLVGNGVLDLIPASAEVVYVGKSKGEHSVAQGEIHRRMIEAAKSGKRVVRLKGGDPFIFGRGGEEVEALRAADVEVEVVPGKRARASQSRVLSGLSGSSWPVTKATALLHSRWVNGMPA